MLDEWNDQLAGAAAGVQLMRLSNDGDEEPLFSLDHRAEFLSQGRGHAVAFAAANDSLFLATSRCFALRHDASGGGVAEIELSRSPEARVRRMFVDPLGLHVLITVQTGSALETLYLDGSWKKARPLPALRGVGVTAVAWPPVLRAGGVREALLGTDKGELWSLTIEDGPTGKEAAARLATLPGPRGAAAPVAGLAQVAVPPPRGASEASLTANERLVLALCGTHLRLFQGGPSLAALFSAYDPSSLPCKDAKVFDLPIEQGAAQLQLLSPPRAPDPGVAAAGAAFRMPPPTEFAVLSTSGVYYGRLDVDAAHADELDHLKAHKLLPASVLLGAGGGAGGALPPPADRPLSLALTQHHLVLLYPSRLQFVNRVSKRVVQEVPLERFAAPLRGAAALPLGLCRDVLAGRVAVLAGDDALEVDAADEDRDMWSVFLGRGEYRAALMYARAAAQRNAVYLAEADALLGEGKAEEAAERYGRLTAAEPPFEELALRLMGAGAPGALRAFLRARLGTLGAEDRAQATMVATWLLELLLDAANRAALGRGEGPAGAAAAAAADAEVQAFLAERVGVLEPGTVVSLLDGYGRGDDLLAFARARRDWEAVLELLVRRGEAERALEVLRKPSVSQELLYRFAPALVALAPAQSVQAWVEAAPPPDPRRLLPALLHLAEAGAPPAARAEALRFVRHCIGRGGCLDSAVHNFAVALLIADAEGGEGALPEQRYGLENGGNDENGDPEGRDGPEAALLAYLASARDALGRPLYDAVHALRLAQEWGRPRATVALLCEVGLWEDAVAAALAGPGRAAAAAVARRPQGDPALTRRLWLAIARHVVGGGLPDDGPARRERVREVSALLDASGGAVHIEDVLPLFPDFVEIGAFKDAICASLERYNEEMEALRGEMAVATRTAAALRESLEAVEGRAAAVDMEEPCASCGRALHLQPPAAAGPAGGALPRLFVFPTGNAFHGSCLCAEAAALAPPPQRERIRRLAARLAAVEEGAAAAPAGDGQPAAPVAELKRQLEDEVAVEDPFAGEIVVRHLTQPFILPEEEAEAASWAL